MCVVLLIPYSISFRVSDAGNIKVLVPGAGLGRLAFEIARQGFQCQGNEFSLFMLFASNFVLNRCVFKLNNLNVCVVLP